MTSTCRLPTSLSGLAAGPALALLLLAGCAEAPEVPEAPPPVEPAAAPSVAPPVLDARARLDAFCGSLSRIVDSEPDGFAPLREHAMGRSVWQGAVEPVGLGGCVIKGGFRPLARYSCSVTGGLGADADALTPLFDDVASDIEHCLDRSSWYPRRWLKGNEFDFSAGERMVQWRDLSETPRPTVVLRIERNVASRAYGMRVSVETLQ